MDGFDFLVKYEPFIKKLAKRSCRGRFDMIDELIEVAYDRVPGIVARFDPSRGVSLWRYTSNSLRLYMFKYMNAEAKRKGQFVGLDVAYLAEVSPIDIDDADSV